MALNFFAREENVLIVFKFHDLDVLGIFFAIAQIVANKTKLCILHELLNFLWFKAMEHDDFELTLLITLFIWFLLIVSLTGIFTNIKNWDVCLFFSLKMILHYLS